MNSTVSIIIPCRNEEEYIGECLQSILQSDYPLELLNIYVCDGCSDDNTIKIVETIHTLHSNVHLLHNLHKTTPFALNMGIQADNSDIVIILGAHSTIDVHFISENVKVLMQNNTIGCSGGVIENIYENATAEMIGFAMSSSFGVGNAHFRTGDKEGFVDTVAFGAYKRAIFEKTGLFDESLTRNQDDEFNYRVIKSGFKIWLSKNIRCKYVVRSSFKNLYKQYFQYGYWKVYVNTKHKTVTTIRQLIPLSFVCTIIGLSILSLFWWHFLYLLGGVCLLYIIGAVLSMKNHHFSICEKCKIFRAYLTLHIAYGLGYAEGLVNFLLLRKKPKRQSESLSR